MASIKILVLGSGMFARPCVEYLSRSPKSEISVGCRTLKTAEILVNGLARTKAIQIDVNCDEDLDKAIAASNVVISLVPFVYHAKIIKIAIANKVNVVTTSYVSPAIRAQDEHAKKAGVVVINEVGVDPGVDHLYAIKTIDEVHSQDGKIKEFYSYCGGLPAPQNNDNPLGMKFSWSPRGVFLSQCNSASFLKDDKRVDIPAADLMANAVPEFYGIPEAHTVIRGSLRYDGNPQLTRALLKTGWLDAEPKEWLSTATPWAETTARATNAKDSNERSLISKIKEICSYTGEKELDLIISGFRWMGLLSDGKATVQGTLLDTLAKHLEKTMSF
ncbi:Saccharopine dehydrogenase [NADP(+),L-glutamate-forming] [Lachnellula willkommii]|uniref:Saccharopine dehydrogenase [NADP(+),L-glutamate-forming] n=1 Tax=Lachnellula willkommii TaxID=215461 RepID=A0A559ME68_9HELO|nr:Saccharopine dehydrogenase [NADP(+),L-glutamate-forming] [Lachnellula willkommii]